jgi:hypothetical protein
MNNIFIVTDSEAGWDCLISAHANLDDLKKYYDVPQELTAVYTVQEFIRKDGNLYVIHEKTLI